MKRRGRGSQCAQASPAVRLLLAGDVLPDLKLNTEEFIFEVSKAVFGESTTLNIQPHNLKLKY